MAFCAYTEYERNKVKKELCKESLFRFMYKKLHEDLHYPNERRRYDYSIIEIWEDAKLYVNEISKADYPDIEMADRWKTTMNMYTYFDGSKRGEANTISSIDQHELTSNEIYNLHFCFAKCVYSILSVYYIVSDKPNDGVFEECMNVIENHYHIIGVDFYNEISCAIDENKINSDYNYWQGVNHQTDEKADDTLTESSMDLSDANRTINEQKEEIDKLKKELAYYTEEPITVTPHGKVRLEIFCKLLEKIGVNFNKYGNKSNAAQLAVYVMELPLSTCKNYMTNRDLSKSKHAEEVVNANKILLKLDIGLQL